MSARTLLRAVLIVAVLLPPNSFFAQDEQAEAAPRFHAKTLKGETFNNASLKGKVVLLQFWTTWCSHCQQEQPVIDKIEQDYSGQGLVVLAVNVGESKKEVTKYLQQNPRACRIVLTGDTNLAAMFEATAYPIYVVIDRDGNIADEQRGAIGESGLRRMLKLAGLRAQ